VNEQSADEPCTVKQRRTHVEFLDDILDETRSITSDEDVCRQNEEQELKNEGHHSLLNHSLVATRTVGLHEGQVPDRVDVLLESEVDGVLAVLERLQNLLLGLVVRVAVDLNERFGLASSRQVIEAELVVLCDRDQFARLTPDVGHLGGVVLALHFLQHDTHLLLDHLKLLRAGTVVNEGTALVEVFARILLLNVHNGVASGLQCPEPQLLLKWGSKVDRDSHEEVGVDVEALEWLAPLVRVDLHEDERHDGNFDDIV
jgi:hypothetical protein